MRHHLLGALLVLVLAVVVGACGGSDTTERPAPEGALDSRREVVGGGTVSNIIVDSPALGTGQAIKVYEPPGLDGAGDVPAVYLLHGQQEDEGMWQSLGVFDTASELINSGRIEPLIIVTPNIDNSFGVNNLESERFDIPDGPSIFYDGNRYEDFLSDDLIAYVDANYPTIDNRNGRYVGGISMGGFAALHLAFRHPDLFSRVGGHSPALVTDPDFTWLYPDDTTAATRNPLRIAETADLADLEVRLDVGEQDEWGFTAPTSELAGVLDARGIQVELDVAPGGHDFGYWAPRLDDYLSFYAHGVR